MLLSGDWLNRVFISALNLFHHIWRVFKYLLVSGVVTQDDLEFSTSEQQLLIRLVLVSHTAMGLQECMKGIQQIRLQTGHFCTV